MFARRRGELEKRKDVRPLLGEVTATLGAQIDRAIGAAEVGAAAKWG